jgi:hypothetical protein
MYLHIGQQIEMDLSKIEVVLQHANGAEVLLAMDSNFRSASWYDSTTNARGRILEEYLMSKQLYILNEESINTTFQNQRGASNIDLTIINNKILRTVVEWEITEQESCSDHNIIKYVTGRGDSNGECQFSRCTIHSQKRELRDIPRKPNTISENRTLQLTQRRKQRGPGYHSLFTYI